MKPSIKKLLLFGSVAPYSGALLALDFVGSRTNGKPYYMLNGVTYPQVSGVPGWTYTGGTPAGTGSYAARQDGSLQFFPSYTNLLLQSQTFDNASWSKTSSSISANAVAAPDGTMTADKIVEAAAASNHGVVQAITKAASSFTYTASYYVKADTRSRAAIWVNGTSSANRGQAGFNLSTGSIDGVAAVSGSFASPSASITPAGNGFYLITLTITSNTDVDIQSRLFVLDGSATAGTPSYTGDGTSGIYVWGAQLELGSTASTYIPTTTAAVTVGTPRITDAGYWAEEARTNLLTYSQQFDNAAWVKTGATVSADVITSPDGSVTADKLSEDTSLGAHRFLASQSKAASATTYTFSAYFKAAERSQMRLAFDDGGSNGASAIFDASNGTISTAAAISGDFTSPSATISPISGGWYRATLTATSNTGTTIRYVVGSALAGSFSYQGVSGSGIYIWQADLQAGAFATSPIPTTSVAVTRAADVGYVSGLVVPSVKTLFANVSALAQDGVERTLMSVNDGSSVNRVNLYRNSSNAMQSVSTVASTSAYTNAVGSFAGAFVTSAATSVSAAEMVTAAAGATTPVRATSSVAMATVSGGTGPAGSQPMNGSIRRIVIYPRAFGNAELQAITTAGAY